MRFFSLNRTADRSLVIIKHIKLNTWRGWPMKPAKGNCEQFLELIQYLCGNEQGSKESFEFLIKWMAYPLQNVGAKMGTAVLMHSDVHGSGKSVLWEKIIKPLYGRNCAATAGQHDMESQYTGGRSGKLFMLFEEILANKNIFINMDKKELIQRWFK